MCRWLFSLLAVAVLCSRTSVAETPHTERPKEFAAASGKELVNLLTDPATRTLAFYELWRRQPHTKQDQENKGFASFCQDHADPELMVCPQGPEQPPLSIVLYGFLGHEHTKITKPSDPYLPGLGLTRRGEAEAFSVFTADGHLIDPFGGNNVLDGVLMDLNGDGLIERAEVTSYGLSLRSRNPSPRVLTVSIVRDKEEPLLRVLLDWDADEWDFHLADEDGDGLLEVQAGPVTAEGVKPKAVWKWDRATSRYVGPAGSAAEHFLVLANEDLWTSLQKLQKAGLTFPKDAEAVERQDRPDADLHFISPPPPSFQPTSLRAATGAELLTFFGAPEAPRQADLSAPEMRPQPSRDSIWEGTARAAVETLLNAGQVSPRFTLPPVTKARLPTHGTVACTFTAPHGVSEGDGHYFLRIDPQHSYLAFSRSWPAPSVEKGTDGTTDLWLCDVPYADACRIGELLWWLNHAQDHGGRNFGFTITSADGSGKLLMQVDGGTVIDQIGPLWVEGLAGLRAANDSGEVLLNFARFLIAEALPARLGPAWAEAVRSEPAAVAKSDRRVADLSAQFLEWFDPHQKQISWSIVADAGRLAGERGFASAAQRLLVIQQALPRTGRPQRTFDAISADIFRLLAFTDPKESPEAGTSRSAARGPGAGTDEKRPR